MDKVIRNGKVAVLYSPGFGAGWSTWNDDEYAPSLLFHPGFVSMVEAHRGGEIDEEYAASVLGVEAHEAPYCGGAADLDIEWVPIGSMFKIDEYDGAESVSITGGAGYFVA